MWLSRGNRNGISDQDALLFVGWRCLPPLAKPSDIPA
jgi:hypothetical protein